MSVPNPYSLNDSNWIILCSVIYLLAALMEISKLLNTGLDSETLTICVRLCESGVNPEALALVIQELRREVATLKASRITSHRIKLICDN